MLFILASSRAFSTASLSTIGPCSSTAVLDGPAVVLNAAGLAIAVNLGAQIKSYNQAVRNANDALNVTQTAEASLNETQNILTRLRELASQAASSGVSNTERGYIQNEVDGLVSEVDRIANATEYNGVSLMNGTRGLTFQVGIRNVGANDQIVALYRSGYLDNAQQSLDITDYAYKHGAASLLDFLDAERSYRATQVGYRQALASYLLALEQLREAVGTRSLP